MVKFNELAKFVIFLFVYTCLDTQLASEPAEDKHIDDIEGVNNNGLGQQQWVLQSLKQ
jgi:hypothetical protein